MKHSFIWFFCALLFICYLLLFFIGLGSCVECKITFSIRWRRQSKRGCKEKKKTKQNFLAAFLMNENTISFVFQFQCKNKNVNTWTAYNKQLNSWICSSMSYFCFVFSFFICLIKFTIENMFVCRMSSSTVEKQ